MEQQNDRRDTMISIMYSCMEGTFLVSCRQIQAELNEKGETVWEELKTALRDVLNQAEEDCGGVEKNHDIFYPG